MPYIDAEYAASLLDASLKGRSSKDDDELMRPLWEEITEAQQAAFEKVKRLALVRERGSHELLERLVHDGFEREDARYAVQRALDCGLIDDIRYGSVLVRTRVSQGRGRHGIEQELERAGISAFDIPGWPDEFFAPIDYSESAVGNGALYCDAGEESPAGLSSQECEVERALLLLRSRPFHAKNLQAAAYRRLVSKGYAPSVASIAVRRFVEEN